MIATPPIDIHFQNKHLNFVYPQKHLGVTLSDVGTWHQHISNVTNSPLWINASAKV
jgi:hypothetical protein